MDLFTDYLIIYLACFTGISITRWSNAHIKIDSYFIGNLEIEITFWKNLIKTIHYWKVENIVQTVTTSSYSSWEQHFWSGVSEKESKILGTETLKQLAQFKVTLILYQIKDFLESKCSRSIRLLDFIDKD